MSDISDELVILSALVKHEEFTRKVMPFIKEEYFADESHKRFFSKVFDFVSKYNQLPDKSTLTVETRNDLQISEGQADRLHETISEVYSVNPSSNLEWLNSMAERFCQDRAVYNAIQQSVSIYQGEAEKGQTIAAIPDILAKAISVSFDRKIGLDYFDSAEERFDFYANPESRVPFRMTSFNDVTCGGVIRKTLNLLVAGVNVGKTLGLVSLSADYIRNGLNVLYISGEMREEMILNRLDANILETKVNDIVNLGKDRFVNRIHGLREKSYGRFIVKEFAPGQATALSIKNTLDELKMKKNFIPDVIICDYLQIMGSYRMAYGSQGSYYYYKAVAEELRALAVESNTVLWTAAQFNRGGMSSSDVEMSDIAESTGIAQTADGMWALIRTEELDQLSQLLVKQLKSRYANRAVKMKFCIGVNIDTQTLFDLDDDRAAEMAGSESHAKVDQGDLKETFLRRSGNKPSDSKFGGMKF